MTAIERLTDRAALLAAAGGHPCVKVATRHAGADFVGYATPRAVGWAFHSPNGFTVGMFGPPPDSARLVSAIPDVDGALLHVPRRAVPLLPAWLRFGDDLEELVFRWTRRRPPRRPGEDRVVRLPVETASEINALLDVAFPDSYSRPGKIGIRAWYGIRDGGQLVACLADSGGRDAGHLAAIAVHPDARGAGLAGALVGAATRRSVDDFGVVGLGVHDDNAAANRLYSRLGYAKGLRRTAGRVALG